VARVDPLIRMMATQGGDELRLVGGEPPRMLQAGRPLRLFLPAMNDATLRGMVEPLADARAWAAFQRGEAVTLVHSDPELGLFSVQARHDEHTEVTIRRVPEARSPAEVPVPPVVSPPVVSSPVVSPPVASPVAEPSKAALPEALEGLLAMAVERGASDLHIAEGEPPTLRIDGRLVAAGAPVRAEALLAALLSPERRALLAQGHAVDFALDLADKARYRANLFHHANGLAAAFRVLTRLAPALDRLDLPVDLRPLAQLPHGLVLVCGPTGSGKSTTLAALIRHTLESRGGVLITLEDPIEYTFSPPRGALVRQRQVGTHVQGFVSGLRDALREDPDILLVGEMRDRETIELALTAAETGHLVFSTLHSRSAAAAVDRIVDAYPAARHGQVRQQLADSMRAIVSQRLLPKARGEGRLPALEVLRATTGVQALIREGRTSGLASAIQAGGGDGMIQLERCLAELVRRGHVSREAAEAAANDRSALADFSR
jgi:twitching motility protein PilT